MTQERLDNDGFLLQLSTLLKDQSGAGKGATYVTQKRLTHESGVSSSGLLPTESGALPSFADQDPGKPIGIIFRASNGKSKRHRADKIKIATVVKPDDLVSFYERYAEVCRAGMDALKKKDRSRLKKKKKVQKLKDQGQAGGVKS